MLRCDCLPAIIQQQQRFPYPHLCILQTILLPTMLQMQRRTFGGLLGQTRALLFNMAAMLPALIQTIQPCIMLPILSTTQQTHHLVHMGFRQEHHMPVMQAWVVQQSAWDTCPLAVRLDWQVYLKASFHREGSTCLVKEAWVPTIPSVKMPLVLAHRLLNPLHKPLCVLQYRISYRISFRISFKISYKISTRTSFKIRCGWQR
mmetsp:Transcript_43714/g.71058  ORF Transcript_43714/g.71058 Transcript_43714/m.71058 type:complete len:203 (+) Transcript_43714:439-1047(+)